MGSVQDDSPQTLTLPADLTVNAVAQLKEQIARAWQESDHLVILLAEVSTCDTAGLQLLIAAQREASCRQKKLTVKDPPESVIQALKRLGLTDRQILTASVRGEEELHGESNHDG